MSAESWTADEIESWRRRHRISHGRYPENCDEHCRWLETLDAARARLGEVERENNRLADLREAMLDAHGQVQREHILALERERDALSARVAAVERRLSNYVETHSGQPADADGASWVPCDCAMCDDARAALARGAEASEA